MRTLSHLHLTSGRIVASKRNPGEDWASAALVGVVDRGRGEIPGSPGWTCNVDRFRSRDGTPKDGAAHMVLSLRIGTGDPVPAILGICCWEEAASASAWRNVTEMCRTFPRNFAPPPDDKPPGLPWLATMPMPMAANIELGEFATGLSSAVDLAWAVIAP